MADVVVFHHAQGLTPGVVAFADELRSAGHGVHVPDLYEGRTFATIDDGVAHAEAVGFDVIVDRGVAAVENLPSQVVYAGFSLGALPAQQLAQCLFVYPGSAHLFADPSLGDYDEAAARLLTQRTLAFLADV